jgi:hypothetical protein
MHGTRRCAPPRARRMQAPASLAWGGPRSAPARPACAAPACRPATACSCCPALGPPASQPALHPPPWPRPPAPPWIAAHAAMAAALTPHVPTQHAAPGTGVQQWQHQVAPGQWQAGEEGDDARLQRGALPAAPGHHGASNGAAAHSNGSSLAAATAPGGRAWDQQQGAAAGPGSSQLAGHAAAEAAAAAARQDPGSGDPAAAAAGLAGAASAGLHAGHAAELQQTMDRLMSHATASSSAPSAAPAAAAAPRHGTTSPCSLLAAGGSLPPPGHAAPPGGAAQPHHAAAAAAAPPTAAALAHTLQPGVRMTTFGLKMVRPAAANPATGESRPTHTLCFSLQLLSTAGSWRRWQGVPAPEVSRSRAVAAAVCLRTHLDRRLPSRPVLGRAVSWPPC